MLPNTEIVLLHVQNTCRLHTYSTFHCPNLTRQTNEQKPVTTYGSILPSMQKRVVGKDGANTISSIRGGGECSTFAPEKCSALLALITPISWHREWGTQSRHPPHPIPKDDQQLYSRGRWDD